METRKARTMCVCVFSSRFSQAKLTSDPFSSFIYSTQIRDGQHTSIDIASSNRRETDNETNRKSLVKRMSHSRARQFHSVKIFIYRPLPVAAGKYYVELARVNPTLPLRYRSDLRSTYVSIGSGSFDQFVPRKRDLPFRPRIRFSIPEKRGSTGLTCHDTPRS